MQLREMLRDTEVLHTEGSLDIDINAITYDSRQATSGSLFFCIEGYRTDGHKYAAAAVEKGAVAVLLHRDIPLPEGITRVFVEDTRRAMGLISAVFHGNPSKDMILFGVTGTNGKTTTTYMIKSILEESGKKVGLIGTITNIIGNRKIPSQRTTPESPDLQKLLGDMSREGVEAAVMEVSSHSLALERVAGCNYEVGVFTNLTEDHLDFHGTMENYRNAKAKLFQQSRLAAINVDDENGRMILEGLKLKSQRRGCPFICIFWVPASESTCTFPVCSVYTMPLPQLLPAMRREFPFPISAAVWNPCGGFRAGLSFWIPALIIPLFWTTPILRMVWKIYWRQPGI